jgi:hypothetical protein
VREIDPGLALTRLSLDPADALALEFDPWLTAARQVLAPILMDWSTVPDGVIG